MTQALTATEQKVTAPRDLDVSYRRILALAWPASVAASITPLLGIVDVWALGRSARPLDIAAVGLAATIFSLIYWTFGFIRMATAGLTAQAAGADDMGEVRLGFVRAALLAGAVGIMMVIFQWPLGQVAFTLLSVDSTASVDTFSGAQTYFSIRIWGAPIALATYACFGWLTARGRTDFLMFTAVIMTIVNMVLDLWLVLVFDLGARGIAAGTLVAELVGFLVSLALVVLILHRDKASRIAVSAGRIFDREKIDRMLSVNRDIFIRTLLLALSFSWFTQRASVFGDVTLAANQVLLHLFLFSGLAIDGTAIAAETLVGQAIGRGRVADPASRLKAQHHYRQVLKRGFVIATIIAAVFMAAYALFGQQILGILIRRGQIFDTAWQYWPWILISPMIVMVCFQLDGIFIGATRSREMRDAMIAAVIFFLPATILLPRYLGNHGLWLAFSAYFLARAAGLSIFLPRIDREFAISDGRGRL